MKAIAISQRVDFHSNQNETRDTLDQSLIRLLVYCGYLPVPVPNKLEGTLRAWLFKVQPTAIVLSGGNDLGQYTIRDETECALLDYAQEKQLPALGICRGMQLMAFWAGVSLHPVKGHVGKRHKLLGKIAREVNSFHNFSLVSCPNGFEVLALSEDREIEAIRHLSLSWEGWMWHPERENQFMDEDISRIRELFG